MANDGVMGKKIRTTSLYTGVHVVVNMCSTCSTCSTYVHIYTLCSTHIYMT